MGDPTYDNILLERRDGIAKITLNRPEQMGFTAAFQHHLVLRMAEGLVPGVPEKDELNKLRDQQGLRAFLQARDGPFAGQQM